MTGKWQVTSNLISGKKKYAVYRLRDAQQLDHSGNREYATVYMDDCKRAAEIAAKLNFDEEESHE